MHTHARPRCTTPHTGLHHPFGPDTWSVFAKAADLLEVYTTHAQQHTHSICKPISLQPSRAAVAVSAITPTPAGTRCSGKGTTWFVDAGCAALLPAAASAAASPCEAAYCSSRSTAAPISYRVMSYTNSAAPMPLISGTRCRPSRVRVMSSSPCRDTCSTAAHKAQQHTSTAAYKHSQ